MNAVGIDVSKGKTIVALQNNFISLTGKTFPGVNELFKSPERADGHQKWVDFVPSFWHCECVCHVSKAAFIQRYRKWCKRKGYNFSEEKVLSLYADSCGHITTPPKSDNTKLLITIEIVFAKTYAEKLDWVLAYFKELYLHFGACFYFDKTDNPTLKTVYKPVAAWDFVSLKILMDMAYAFMVSDDSTPLRICKHCGNVFTASHVKTEFCSPQCRNQYNVYKSRGK